MRKLLIIILCLLTSIGVFAQKKYIKNIAATEVLSKNTTKLFSEGKVSEAFELVIPYWPLPIDEMETIKEKTLEYMDIVEQRFGKSIGFLRIKRETIKDFAIRETYIIKHKFHALRIIFTYYKSNEGWLINSFKWDDSFTDEFKEE